MSLNVIGAVYNSKTDFPMKGIQDLFKVVMLVPRNFVPEKMLMSTRDLFTRNSHATFVTSHFEMEKI